MPAFSFNFQRHVRTFVTALVGWLKQVMSKHDLNQSTPYQDLSLIRGHLDELPSYCYQNFVMGIHLAREKKYQAAVQRFHVANFAAVARENKGSKK